MKTAVNTAMNKTVTSILDKNRFFYALKLRAFSLFFLSTIVSAASAFEGTVIQSVEVAGNSRIEKDAVLEKMSLKSGFQLTKAAVRKDTLSIFEMGFFEDVRLELIGNKLQVRLKERPIVTEIRYEDASEFESKDLDDVAAIKPFTVLNLAKVRQAQLAIAKKYEEKGYYLARADYSLVPVPDRSSEVHLVFKVTENEKVRVRRIYFSGNKKFSSADLKQVMITGEGHFFSWASGGGTYREDAFERDLAVLAYFYGNEGYIQAKFTKPRVSLSQDRRYIDIFMDVDEGEQFFLGDLRFQGQELLFTEEELVKSFEMLRGDVFGAGKLQEQIMKLTDKYGDEGYAFANVIPRPMIRVDEKIVDLIIDIERGEKVYWGKIHITGNSKTHDKVIRRELTFAEGELYNATKRKRGLERIRRLGFFDPNIGFITSTPSGSNNVLDLEIRVQEKPTGSLNVSAGFGTSTKFSLQGQVSQNNLFGLGQQLSFELRYDAISRSVNLGWADPKIFDSEWLLGADLFLMQDVLGTGRGDYRRSYDQQRYGFSLRTGREISQDLALYGTYKLARNMLLNPIGPEIFLSPDDEDSFISSVVATMAYDTRNNRMDPSGGEYLSASSEFAGLGGRVFQKYLLAAKMYRRLFWRFVWRSNVEYGLLANGLTDDPVPVYELYRAGGFNSLRGYPYLGVGPTVRVTPTRADAVANDLLPFNDVQGGTNKFVLSQEVEFPLIPEADIRAVVFFDAGNAWNTLAGASPILYSNYGWGIRWYSPLGPLRFEWGFPLNVLPTKGDRRMEFVFIIAPTF